MIIRVVFFDLGDTLVQIAPDILEDSARQITLFTGRPVNALKLKKAERAEWLDKPARDFLWVQTEEQEWEFWERDFYPAVLRRLGILDYPLQLVQLLAARAMDPKSFVPFPEVPEVLTKLEQAGIELGIISNSFPSTEGILRGLALEHRFRYIIFSHQIHSAKPDPEIYLAALRRANIQPDAALFVDDRGPMVKGAADIGIRALLVNRNGYSTEWRGAQISDLREILAFQSSSQAVRSFSY